MVYHPRDRQNHKNENEGDGRGGELLDRVPGLSQGRGATECRASGEY